MKQPVRNQVRINKLLYQDWVEDKMRGNSWELNLGPLKKKSTKLTENWQSYYILIKLLFAEQMKHSNYLDWPEEQSLSHFHEENKFFKIPQKDLVL